VLGKILRIASLVATLIVVASFVMFVVDQTTAGSHQEVAQLNADAGQGIQRQASQTNLDVPDPSPAVKRERSKRHSAVRNVIDDADDVVLRPFVGIVHTNSVWASRLLPGLLALLIFGVGLRILAGYVEPAKS
jgi:hypothetical protein